MEGNGAGQPTLMKENTVTNDPNFKIIEQKLRNILYSVQFCGVCWENDKCLKSIHQNYEIDMNGKLHNKPLKNFIDDVFYDVKNIPASAYICIKCIEKVIQSYIFICTTKETVKLMSVYVNDFYYKSVDLYNQLDPFCSYENSNVIIVLETNSEKGRVSTKSRIRSKEVKILQHDHEIKGKADILTSRRTTKKILRKINCGSKTKSLQSKVNPRKIKIVNLKGIVKKKVAAKLPVKKIKKVTPEKTGYECMKCNEILPTFNLWKQHERTYHKKAPQCKICYKTFENNTILTTHYLIHNKVKCKICHLLLQVTELTDHLKLNHEDLTYPCQHCDLVYYTEPALVAHLKISHYQEDKEKKDDLPQCLMCLKCFQKHEIKYHLCKDKCSECTEVPCIHHKYLISFKEQVLNHASTVKCLECDFMCRRREAMIAHVNRVHLDYHPYSCDSCGMQFYSKNVLKRHIVYFHREQLNCEYCDQNFTSNNKFQVHIKACQFNKREFECKECVASFESSLGLNNHVKMRHSLDNYPCNMCNSKFLTEENLQDHKSRSHRSVQITKSQSRWECVACNKKFDTRGEYLQHLKSHDPSVKYLCKICNIEFENIKKLQWHNRKHKTKVKPKETCHICNKEVASLRGHLYHHALMKKPPVHTCELCGKSFAMASKLKLHQLVHLEKAPCDICKKLVKPSGMLCHKRSHKPKPDTEVKKVQRKGAKCEHCDYTAHTTTILEGHVNKYHLNIQPYVCTMCQDTFYAKYLLKLHMQVHSDAKNYSCNICNNRFRYRLCLKKHMMLHTGEKPNVCDVCGEAFTCSSYLNEHKLKHSEKTVSCPLCGAMFYSLKNMRQHFKKQHWKDKDRKFNPKELVGKEYYYLFEDRRKVIIDSLAFENN